MARSDSTRPDEGAYDAAVDADPALADVEIPLLTTVTPVPVRPGAREELLAAVADVDRDTPVAGPGEGDDGTLPPAVTPGETTAGDPVARPGEATVHPLVRPRRGSGRAGRPRWGALAAAVVLLAAVGGAGALVVGGGDRSPGEGDVVARPSGTPSPATAVDAAPGAGEHAGHPAGGQGPEEMHAIMGATDARSAELDASGAELDVVVSGAMGKGGAMVDGRPALDDGMGAQVWSVGSDGRARSAGVIDQAPHDGVWMPLPGDTVQVVLTVEPAAGSPAPTGPVLARATL
ncbi:anti-sigma factor [Corynebacterium bovis]|uniref:anti-sigma factor n=1 Tax=Corynebacterium bovis TaxID=36808 RepID=UPI00254A517B|nr:anti-sigma factor [Corynebacterium bovis]MDK8510478.1 anti-sigma factor [Corynebacterium bovis]